MLVEADHVNAASAVVVMTVVVATSVVAVGVETIETEIVPNAQIAHRAKMASHPSHVSQEPIARLVNHANLEQTAYHVSRAQKAKNNASHVNLEPNEHHVRRVSHALIVQIYANHVRAMHQHKQRLRKL